MLESKIKWNFDNEGYCGNVKVAYIHQHGNFTAFVYPTGKPSYSAPLDQIHFSVRNIDEGKQWCEQNFNLEIFEKANLVPLLFSETHKAIMVEKREVYIPTFGRVWVYEKATEQIVEITKTSTLFTLEQYQERYPDTIFLGYGRRIENPQ